MKISKPIVKWFLVLLIALFVATGVFAIVEPDTGFEIEGNINRNTVGNYDWNPLQPGAVLIVDPHSKSEYEPSQFRPDGKFDDPSGWVIQDGSVGPAQNELTNIFAWSIAPGDVGNSQSWVAMGMERTKDEGTFALDFEFNQKGWDGQSGTLVREPGDLVVGFELKGNPDDPQTDLQVLIAVFDPFGQFDNNVCKVTDLKGQKFIVETGTEPCPAYGKAGWYYRYLSNASGLGDFGEATMNPVGFDQDPFGAYHSYDAHGDIDNYVGEFEFAEAIINLEFAGLEPGCPGFATVHAKTRSSLEVGSDLKDLAGPAPFPVDCYIEGYKYHDINGNGTRDEGEPGLNGWTINLSNGDSLVTGDNPETGEPGYYRFEGLGNGNYAVSEDCTNQQSGWVQTEPYVASDPICGDGVYNFVVSADTPTHIGNFGNGLPDITITKECPTDVWYGDDVTYDIEVENTGNVTLNNVTIVDSTLGVDTNIGTLEPGGIDNIAPVAQDVTSDLDNTASVSGEFGGTVVYATVDDSDDCTTNVHSLTVEKDATPSLTRTYAWVIDKVVDGPESYSVAHGEDFVGTINYDITVDLAPGYPMDSNWAVAGTIDVINDTPLDAELAGVSDLISPDIAASVDCGVTFPYTLLAGDTLYCDYSHDLPNDDTRSNTATATMNNNDEGTTDFDSDPVSVDFANAVITLIDEEVEVYEDPNNTPDNTGDDTYLGTVAYNEAPKTFKFAINVNLIAPGCGSVTVTNRARFITNDTQTEGSDTADVIITVACNGCTPGYWQGGQLDTNGNSGLQRWNEWGPLGDPDPDPQWGGIGDQPFIQSDLFNGFFEPHPNLVGLTMLDIVGSGGTSDEARKAARSLIAAYLNESAFPDSYPAPDLATLENWWYVAVHKNGNNPHVMGLLELHTLLDDWNNAEPPGTCPAPIYD